jgi:hypothetical protein
MTRQDGWHGARSGELDPARIVADAAADTSRTSGALPDRLCTALGMALRVDGAGIATFTNTSLRHRLGVSDEVAERLETVQFTVGEGPCVEAAATGRPVIVTDLHAQAPTRWPAFADAAAQHLGDIGSVFAFPLRVDHTVFGSVNLYSRTRRTWHADEVALAADAVVVAATALLETPRGAAVHLSEAQPDVDDPWRTMHLAIGMIAGQLRAPTEDALARMRGYAISGNLLLTELARGVLAGQVTGADLLR